MSPIEVDLQRRVRQILSAKAIERAGRVVPTNEAVGLQGDGVRLDGAVLFADLGRSSELVEQFEQRIASRVMKSFLACMARLIKANQGEVTAFDGDRVMGVFLGKTKEFNAVRCALSMTYAVAQVVDPEVRRQFTALQQNRFQLTHCCGVDTGSLLVVRAGQRQANDLVWVGRPANLAAKLSQVRMPGLTTFVSEEVLVHLPHQFTNAGNPLAPIWTQYSFEFAEQRLQIHGSSAWVRL